MQQFHIGCSEGQTPLLIDPPCHCDRDAVHKFSVDMATVAAGLANYLELCTVARATALCLVAAAMVNPRNCHEDDESDIQTAKEASMVLAEQLELIARGVRLRASE